MNYAMAKTICKSMHEKVEELQEVMKSGSVFYCDICMGTNFETCNEDERDVVRMVAGGKVSYWCCGYCKTKNENASLRAKLLDLQ